MEANRPRLAATGYGWNMPLSPHSPPVAAAPLLSSTVYTSKLKDQREEKENARLSDKQRPLLKMKDLLSFLDALFGQSGIKRTKLLRIRSALRPSVFFFSSLRHVRRVKGVRS